MTPACENPAEQPPVMIIRCREHGPLVIELPRDEGGQPLAVVRINDHLGQSFPLPSHKQAVALCRCGQSATRPFCDGSHRQCGFLAGEKAPTLPPTANPTEKTDQNSSSEGDGADPGG